MEKILDTQISELYLMQQSCEDGGVDMSDFSPLRWSGLVIAKGKYIQYLDGDDTLLDYAVELLVRKAEDRNADIVAAPFYFCYPDQTKT